MKKSLTLLCSALILAALAAPLARADDAKSASPAPSAAPMVTGPSVNQTGDPMPDRQKGTAKKAKKKGGKKKKDAAAAPASSTAPAAASSTPSK